MPQPGPFLLVHEAYTGGTGDFAAAIADVKGDGGLKTCRVDPLLPRHNHVQKRLTVLFGSSLSDIGACTYFDRFLL